MKKITSLFMIGLIVLMILTACVNSQSRKTTSYNIKNIDVRVVKGNNDFAFELFKTLNMKDSLSNILISPFSISSALTMTYNGAESSTKEGMEKTLGFTGIDRNIINDSFQNLTGYLTNMKKIKLKVGNSIWIKDGEKIEDEFIKENEENFFAKVDTLDFSDPRSVKKINDWIEDATKGKIKGMLQPPISPATIMYLINAVYFKGEWSKQFDPQLTRQDYFNPIEGNDQKVKFMRKNGDVEYGELNGIKSIRLPYGDGSTSMYLLLPGKDKEINDWIQAFSIEEWDKLRRSITETEDIVVQIPRFKLDYGIKNLKYALESLGMEEAFTEQADFSGIRDITTTNQRVYINSVLHKAVIEVNEEGSEAAASTVVQIKDTATAEPLSFIADRPFLIIINDDMTNTILFMGKVVSIDK